MTKRNLAILSDLHFDLNELDEADFATLEEVLVRHEITDLHFAGDMSNDFKALTLPILRYFSEKFQVTYNLGNHDMLGLTEAEIQAQDFKLWQIGKQNVLAFAGWYDYSFYPSSRAAGLKQAFYFDRKIHRDFDDPTTTAKVLEQLDQVLAGLSQPPLVIMHFVPEKAFSFFSGSPRFDRLNAYLGSESFHDLFVKYQIKNVVFGHVHHRFSPSQIHGVTYQARPLGYMREWQMVDDFFREFPSYRIAEMYKLRKRFQKIRHTADWQHFKKENLMKEFEKSLVIFKNL